MVSIWIVFILLNIFLKFLKKKVSNLHQFLSFKTQRERRGFKKICVKNNKKIGFLKKSEYLGIFFQSLFFMKYLKNHKFQIFRNLTSKYRIE